MTDLRSRLEETTPSDLRPVDVQRIAARHERRRRTRRVGVAAIAACAIGALVTGVVTTRSDGDTDRIVSAGTGSGSLIDDRGTWVEAARAPFSPRWGALGGVLNDGRILVWGGASDDGRLHDLADGGIYDPGTDTWTKVSGPALPKGLEYTASQLTDDRLAVLGWSVSDGLQTPRVAIYDVATDTWSVPPVQDAFPGFVDGLAWDGTHLALIRVSKGFQPDSANAPDGRIDQPVTVRWTYGDREWSTGTPAPLAASDQVATAFDGYRLAVWGDPRPDEPPDDISSRGAIYDLATDTWTLVPPPATDAGHVAMLAWHDGRLLVQHELPADPSTTTASGPPASTGETGADGSPLETFDPTAGTWTPLPVPPSGLAYLQRDLNSYDEQQATFIASNPVIVSGPRPTSFLDQEQWVDSPLEDLHILDGHVAATSVTGNNPGSGPFQVRVRGDDGQWLPLTDAPFENRMDAFVVAADDEIFVFGGLEGPDIQVRGDAWILRSAP